MLWFRWDADSLERVLAQLTQDERNAIACYSDVKKKPGLKTATLYGFKSIQALDDAFESGRSKALLFLKVNGIVKLSDLDFAEPDRSVEGRMQKARKAQT